MRDKFKREKQEIILTLKKMLIPTLQPSQQTTNKDKYNFKEK